LECLGFVGAEAGIAALGGDTLWLATPTEILVVGTDRRFSLRRFLLAAAVGGAVLTYALTPNPVLLPCRRRACPVFSVGWLTSEDKGGHPCGDAGIHIGPIATKMAAHHICTHTERASHAMTGPIAFLEKGKQRADALIGNTVYGPPRPAPIAAANLVAPTKHPRQSPNNTETGVLRHGE